MAGSVVDRIGAQLQQSAAYIQTLASDVALHGQIAEVVDQSVNALRQSKKLLFAGNGGSAADSQHLAAELVSRFGYDRPALAGLALTTDTSILTAIGNDYGYEHLFSRQIEALANSGDVVFLLSTSGRSPNILRAARAAREKKVFVVGLTGRAGGSMPELCDILLRMPHDETARIQEGHIAVGHLICGEIERQMFPKP